MSLRNLLIYIIFSILALLTPSGLYAQTINQDSATAARKQALEIMRARQKFVLDSTRASRQHILDSTKAVRQKRTDSLAAVRKYRESKRYKDSVTKARETALNAVKAERMAKLDSAKAVRQKSLDSMTAIRKATVDSMRARQKHRADSMAAVTKYRESKRYKDSVAVVRQLKTDSMKAVRKIYNDSVAAVRKKTNDSLAAERKKTTDSIAAIRKVTLDSMKAVRKVKADSIAKAKEIREKNKKNLAKAKEEKMQLALELKIKKKQEAWSNEKMLKKKWSLPRQVIQNTFTRYNYYFNSDKKMDEALDNMQRVRKENYDSLLALFPFDPDIDSSILAPDMDSIIQKASVGIQIHDPRTKWGDDLYLLLGQAYYYKGDYKNAAIAFRYIVSLKDKVKKKNNDRVYASRSNTKGPSIALAEDKSMLDFLKHRSAHNEALLWLARTYTESHQDDNAASVIDLLEADPNMPQSLKGRLALEKAYAYLGQGNRRDASKELTIVTQDGELPDWVRMRAAYLNGQLLQEAGDHKAAAASYDKVLDLNPKIDMDFYARKNMANSLMNAGGDQESSIASLKKILKDGKYASYYEQVYYIIGMMAAKNNDRDDAIEYLNKSISSAKSTRKQKALSFAALGGVYYDMHSYMAAKNAYDSAAVFASAAGADTSIAAAMRRGVALGSVTKPLIAISSADSMLALGAMSNRDQLAAVRRYIRRLEQEKADSAFRAENGGLQNAAGQAQPTGAQAPSYANWYFANPVLMQQGMNEFKRRWGNRPLTDNWQRSAATGTNTNSAGSIAGSADMDEDSGLDENGLPTEASLMAQIPNDPEKKEALNKRNQESYISLANAYYNQLQDYPQALATLDTLDKRYPSHIYKADALYIRYLVAMNQGRMDDAKRYNAQLLREHPDSKWADMVRPSEDGGNMATLSNTSVANFYDESYALLMQRQYTEVLQRTQQAQRQYKNSAYQKRFRIMEAIALVGAGNYNRADSLLTEFMTNNQSDSLRAWAEATMNYIKKNRPVTPPPANLAPTTPGAKDTTNGGVPPSSALQQPGAPAPTAPTRPPVIPLTFTYHPNEEHVVIFSFSKIEQRAMGVKAAIGDFNTFKFGSLGLNVDVKKVNDEQGVMTVQPFKTAAQAKIYMNALRGTAQVFREYKTGEYQIFIISTTNLIKLLNDKNIQPYMNFYKANYK